MARLLRLEPVGVFAPPGRCPACRARRGMGTGTVAGFGDRAVACLLYGLCAQ